MIDLRVRCGPESIARALLSWLTWRVNPQVDAAAGSLAAVSCWPGFGWLIRCWSSWLDGSLALSLVWRSLWSVGAEKGGLLAVCLVLGLSGDCVGWAPDGAGQAFQGWRSIGTIARPACNAVPVWLCPKRCHVGDSRRGCGLTTIIQQTVALRAIVPRRGIDLPRFGCVLS
jgi:hypothetical protein